MVSFTEIDDEATSFCKSNPGASAGDLETHLQSKFSSASPATILGIVSSHIPTPYPTSPAVIKRTKSPPMPWYSYQPALHENYKHFSTVTLPKVMNLPTAAIDTIAASSMDIVNLIPDPSNPTFKPTSGLIIGNVQSGKTANFTGLVARAADSGYNLIIVLSGGNFNDLREQTQKRLFKDLIDAVNLGPATKKWHKATNWDPSPKNSGDVGSPGWNESWDISATNCLIVTKKNADTLRKLAEWIERHVLGSPEPVNLLLIDDEADHASLNLLVKDKKGEASQINHSIRNILSLLERNVYIGFTASPFANMFVPPQTDGYRHPKTGPLLPTLYPRDFIYLLPEPQGYFGLKKMCPGNYPSFSHPHLWQVSEEEAKFYRENSTVRKIKDALKDGLKAAIFDSFISLGIRYIRKGSRNFHHSMLIHTIVTKKEMHGILGPVTPFVSMLRDTIHSGGTTDTTKELFNDFKLRYAEREKSIDKAPDFNDLRTAIREYFNDIKTSQYPDVLEVSSDPQKGSDLQYPKDEPYFVIAIGALRLSRGFTLEGLFTSYFVREPETVKSDTLLQQGRWFGFRLPNEDLVSIHLTSSLADRFWELKEVENDLHDAVHHFQDSQLDPIYFAVPVMKAAGQIPTEMGKIPKKRSMIHSLLESDYLPKKGTGFPISITSTKKASHAALNEQIKAEFDGLIGKALKASGGPFPTRDGNGHYIFEKVPLDAVQSFLKAALPNFIDDPFKSSRVEEFLETRKKHGKECSSWTIAVIGNKKSAKDQTITFKSGSPHSFTLSLVSRSRTHAGSDDIGTFTQDKHFEIGINPKPPSNLTRRKLCSLRARENPLMLVYLVDKDSKPKISPRAPLGTSSHIFTMAIAFPPATLTDEEKKKYNSEIWWNADLDLDE